MTRDTLSAAIRPHSPELADWLDSLPDRPDRVRAWPLKGRLPSGHHRGSPSWPVATLAIPYNLYEGDQPVGPVWVMVFEGEKLHPDCKEVPR